MNFIRCENLTDIIKNRNVMVEYPRFLHTSHFILLWMRRFAPFCPTLSSLKPIINGLASKINLWFSPEMVGYNAHL